jgi:hypothetical protein
MKEMTQYYKEKLNQGLFFQDFVLELLYENGLPIISYSSKEYQNTIGENKAGIEIKNDRNFRKTGNLYIEVAEKSNPENINFVPSGIYRNDKSWLYLIGDEEKIFILSKKQLQLLHKIGKYEEKQTPTSRGFLLLVTDAEKLYSLKEIIPTKIIQRKLEKFWEES